MNTLVLNHLIKIASAGLNNKITKSYAKRMWNNIKKAEATGDSREIAKATQKAGVLSAFFKRGARKVSDLATQEKVLNKNITLRKQLYYNLPEQTAGTGYFTHFKKLPMIDIDTPGASHKSRNVIRQSKYAALKSLFDYLKTPVGKKSIFATYETPGGIRLFDLSRRRTPKQFYTPTGNPGGKESGLLNLRLGGDPDYPPMNMLKRKAYATRISPKPGRKGDNVAEFLDYYGDGEVIKRNLLDLKTGHDDLIARILRESSDDKISLGGLFDLL